MMMLAFGRAFYMLLGGRSGVLEQAMHYSQVLFSGAILDLAWLNYAGLGIRGNATMRIPSATLIGTRAAWCRSWSAARWVSGCSACRNSACAAVAAGPACSLHARGHVPHLVPSYSHGEPAPSRLMLNFKGFTFPARHVFRHSKGRRSLLPVAAADCADRADFHQDSGRLRHRDIGRLRHGSRLEFLLTPIAFAFGVASVPMVGMAMGAGLVTRARQVAWDRGHCCQHHRRRYRINCRNETVAVDPRCSPAIPASPQPLRRISPGQRRHSPFSAWAPASISPRKAQQCRGPVIRRHGKINSGRRRRLAAASSGAPAWTLFALVGAAMAVYGLGTALSIRLTPLGK